MTTTTDDIEGHTTHRVRLGDNLCIATVMPGGCEVRLGIGDKDLMKAVLALVSGGSDTGHRTINADGSLGSVLAITSDDPKLMRFRVKALQARIEKERYS